MAVYFSKAGIQIWHGDCRELLPSLAYAVQAIVSDPPYGIAYAHSGGPRGVASGAVGTKSANARGNPPIVGDDRPFDPSSFLSFERLVLWGCDRNWTHVPRGGGMLCWDKSPLGRGPADSFVDAEFAWINWREPRNVFRMLWKGLCQDKRGEDNGRRWHPTQKPVRLMAWCLERADRQKVCDPFMGAGATALACVRTGREFVGIEIQERYCEIAAQRIERELKQGRLPLTADEAATA